MSEVKSILHKHIAAVHQSAPLTMVQRKAMNMFLLYSQKNIAEVEIHEMPINKLILGLGWKNSSHQSEQLIDALKELVSIRIEWNIFNQDRRSAWVASSLLASVSISEGKINYAFSPHMRNLLAHRNIYASLDLDVQKKLKSQYAQILWEYIIGVLSTKKYNSICTDWIPYQSLLKLMYLLDTVYENRYALFQSKVLKKAIGEINEFSEVNVSYETKSERNKVTHIRFNAKKKSMIPIELDCCFQVAEAKNALFEKLQLIGLSTKYIDAIYLDHSELEIENTADYVLTAFLK